MFVLPARGGRLEKSGRLLKAIAGAALAVLLSGCGASLNSAGAGLGDGQNEPKLGAAALGTASQVTDRVDEAVGATASGVTAQAGASRVAAKSEGSSSKVVPASTALSGASSNFIAASAPGNTAYKIGPQDVLEFSVFQVPELTRASQVSDGGTVSLPLVGEVPAAGLTAQEVERDLTKRLKAKYLQNPQVSVFVKEFNSQRITVEGAVKKQGVYPLRGKTSLLQTIAMAEGLDAGADASVVVFRMTDKGRTAARFDLTEIRAGTAEDPLLRSGDLVVVGASFWKEQFGNFVKVLPLIGVFALL